MSKRQVLAILGFWTIIFLFLGFPIGWDKWIAVITGVLVIFVAYRKPAHRKSSPSSDHVFVENNVSAAPDTTSTQ